MSQYSFSQVPRADIPRSSFNRNHNYKTTFDSGYLIPFYVDEALPGDTFNVRVNAFARMTTPIVPLMDNLYMDMFFFAVPNRLVWDNWQKFCGEQVDPGDSIDYTIPILTTPGVGGWDTGSIYDYMGLPVATDLTGLTISALPLRAYYLIWNEWFRDQNLQDSLVVSRGDGPDFHTDYSLKRRGKRHDYFTSALPWPQKGPAMTIPIGPIVADGTAGPTFKGTPGASGGRSLYFNATANTQWNPAPSVTETAKWDDPNLTINMSSGGTINDLRQAFQIQRLLERDARGGTRYVEILKAHFNVTSPDARLQRPEYLGGSSTPISINPVAQTSASPATPSNPSDTPQGNLSAYGVVGTKGNGFTKSFVEHSIIIGMVMVRADISYQQQINRMWSRRTRYDFFWPALAHLGEQAVLNKEIGNSFIGNPNGIWGYQERWAEYRYMNSAVTGLFRSTVSGGNTSLDYWHLAQALSAPALNATFIEENPPIGRVVAVPDEPEFLFDSHFQVKCARPMPLYSVPGMADHF